MKRALPWFFVALVLLAGVASADTWQNTSGLFLRDTTGNLDVNVNNVASPLPVNVTAGAGSATGSPAYTRVQDGTGTTLASVEADANSSPSLRVTLGMSKTAALTVAQGTVVVSNAAGRIGSMLVTTAGTAQTICYDNASAASGTIIAETPATTTLATVYVFNMPAVNGITCSNPASSAAVTVSYN